METGKTPSPKIINDLPASSKKAEIHHPPLLFLGKGKIRKYETYLHFLLGKFDEKNIAAVASFSPNASTPICRKKGRAIFDPAS